MIALTLLLGCSTAPTVTSESLFVGRLVDAAGEPLADVEIKSIEGQHRTDDFGSFAVPIQPPSKLVHFVVDDVFYQRVQMHADLGTEVTVPLPNREARTVVCPPMDCDVSLSWRLDKGLSAKTLPKCTDGATVELPGVPAQLPEGTCRRGKGRNATDVPLDIDVDGTTWSLREAGGDVTVEVIDLQGQPVPGCEVTIGPVKAALAEDGTFVARAHHPSTITAVCDGQPAQPARVTPSPEGSKVTVYWASQGPVVDIGSIAPWAERAVLRNRDTGWELSAAIEAGQLSLPPMKAGQYTVYLRGKTGSVPLDAPDPINAPDVLSFTQLSEQSWVGRLNLTRDVSMGSIDTHVAPKR